VGAATLVEHLPVLRSRRVRSVLTLLVQWGLVAVLFALVLPQLSQLRPPRAADVVHPGFLPLAVLAEGASFLATVALQRMSVCTSPRQPGWWTMTWVNLAALAIGNLAPGGPAVAGVYAARRYREHGVSSDVAASGQLVVNLLTGLSIGLLGLLAFTTSDPSDFPHRLTRRAWLGFGLLAAAITLACAVGVLLLRLHRTRSWLLRSKVVSFLVGPAVPMDGEPAPGPDERRGRIGAVAMRPARPMRLDELAVALLAALAVLAGDLLCLLLSLRALHVRPTVPSLLTGYVIVTAIALLPVTPGGLGLVEAGLAGLLVTPPRAADRLAAAVLVYRFSNFGLPVGLGLLSLIGDRVVHLRRRRAGVLATLQPSDPADAADAEESGSRA
jgi:uncharacterized membrane protein YbhN (UPF0104 family)